MTTIDKSLISAETNLGLAATPRQRLLEFVGNNILHNNPPAFLATEAEIIPEKIRHRTSLTFAQSAVKAVSDILASQNEGTNLTFSDTDGVIVYGGAVIDRQQLQALQQLQSERHKLLITTNRKPNFPFTKAIQRAAAQANIETFMGQDQQNPYNHKPIREALLASIKDFVTTQGALTNVNFIFDTLNLLPLTWYDFIRGTGITNAFFPQSIVSSLVRQESIPKDSLPKINLYAVNPFITDKLTIDY